MTEIGEICMWVPYIPSLAAGVLGAAPSLLARR